MPDEEKEVVTATPPPPDNSKKKTIIIIAVLVVVGLLLAGGIAFFVATKVMGDIPAITIRESLLKSATLRKVFSLMSADRAAASSSKPALSSSSIPAKNPS